MSSYALKYYGGKQRFAKWIISNFPQNGSIYVDKQRVATYVEPFCGSAAVCCMLADDKFANKYCNITRIINDIDDNLINMLRHIQIQNDCQFFQSELCQLEYDNDVFKMAQKYVGCPNLRLSAQCEYILLRMSRNGDRKSFAECYRVRRGMNEGTSKWLSGIDALANYSKQLQNVVIENRTAARCIQQHDCKSTLFYVDPPYLPITRGIGSNDNIYRHEMTELQHIDLLAQLQKCEGMVCLSGYVSELYCDMLESGVYNERVYNEHGRKWRREDLITSSSAATGSKKAKRVESLWMNY